MASTIFVENIGSTVTEAELTERLSELGTIESIELAKDDGAEGDGQVAFITMRSSKQGRAAIAALDGQTLGGLVAKAKAMKRDTGPTMSKGASGGLGAMGGGGRRGGFGGKGAAFGRKGRGKAGGRNR